MAIGSQYGEDVILTDYFKNQESGFLVDVGAADGEDNSNSFFLLKRPGWGGILIEPEPTQFAVLDARYKERLNVQCLNCAVGEEPGSAILFCGLQVSTLSRAWRDRCITAHGIKYVDHLVSVRPLSALMSILQAPCKIDFLSIDCEGMDVEVLSSLNLTIWKPRLICIEAKVPIEGYHKFCETRGNWFFERD